MHNGQIATTLKEQNALKYSILSAITNATTVEVLPADANTRYAVYYVGYGVSAAGSLVFKSGTTAISTTYTTAGAGTVIAGNQDANTPLFVTDLNAALNITTTGTANHTANIIVAKLPR